ncbi:sigma-70 family RNA polymerase sigma factor [Undibacterium sp. SXout11W]|uniref:sigma-70 family RNA polymerase sigma factor n=1 Tax=Undibacterium TaxID=401469 RepID=UPI003BF09BDA
MTQATSDASQLHHWLAAIAKQDGRAFQALYEATSAKLFGFALRILHKRELAEEVLQESYVNIWNNAANYQASLAAPMTWMVTIVRHRAIDQLRRIDHDVEIDGEDFDMGLLHTLESTEPTPTRHLELSQDARALSSCMSRLENTHRQAMALAFFHDLSHSEVAQQLSLPIGTVKTWIRRGLDKLRLCLNSREAS